MKINNKTLVFALTIGIILASLMGYWIYHAWSEISPADGVAIMLGLILFCATTFWSYQAIEAYKQKKKQN